jgi:hypothetical protein
LGDKGAKMDDDNVKKLAQELVNSGEKSFSKTFTLSESDDVVVVIAIRTSRNDGESMKKFSESIIRKAVAGPSGQPCPLCGGSGKR